MPFNSKHFKNINKNKSWAIKADCRWDHLNSEMQLHLPCKLQLMVHGDIMPSSKAQKRMALRSHTGANFYYLQLWELFLIIQIFNTIHSTSWLWNSFSHLHSTVFGESWPEEKSMHHLWVRGMRKTQILFLYSASPHNHITLSCSCRVLSVTRTVIFSTIRM